MAMSAEERQQMLLTQPVEKIIPKMALPTICSMLITSIYNMNRFFDFIFWSYLSIIHESA